MSARVEHRKRLNSPGAEEWRPDGNALREEAAHSGREESAEANDKTASARPANEFGPGITGHLPQEATPARLEITPRETVLASAVEKCPDFGQGNGRLFSWR